MAVIFIDGFDKYGIAGQAGPAPETLMAQGEWTTVNLTTGGMAIVPGLSLSGYAVQLTQDSIYTCVISKTLVNSYTRLIGGYRVSPSGSGNNNFFTSASGSGVWTITIAATGIIYLTSTSGGTLGYGGALSQNSTHFIEFDITIGSSASYQVWLDGISIIQGTGNTGSTPVNGFGISQGEGTGTFDDLYLFDDTGSTNNAVLLSNPRVETQFPTGNSEQQFTNYAVVFGAYNQADLNTVNLNSNTLSLRQFVTPGTMTLNSISCVPRSTQVLSMIGVLYADNAGVPGSLIASGAPITVVYDNYTATSAWSPQTLEADTAYWIGFMTNTTTGVNVSDGSITGWTANVTYTDGAPSPAPSMTPGQSDWQFWANGTTTNNWMSQGNNPSFGDASYVASSSPGATDLYEFPNLVITPVAIYTVGVKSNMRVTDSGNRTVDLLIQSNSITSSGSAPNQVPYTSYGWQDSFFDTDPNTSSAWTQEGLDNSTAGFTIVT